VIKSKFALFQEQEEVFPWDAVIFSQNSLRLAPEVFNPIDMIFLVREEFGMVDAVIRTAMDSAVSGINNVTAKIQEIDSANSAVSAAVEEQSAATKEIARNIEEVASGTEQVTSNIAEVTSAAQTTGDTANDVNTAANELSTQAERLRLVVGEFLIDARKVA